MACTNEVGLLLAKKHAGFLQYSLGTRPPTYEGEGDIPLGMGVWYMYLEEVLLAEGRVLPVGIARPQIRQLPVQKPQNQINTRKHLTIPM